MFSTPKPSMPRFLAVRLPKCEKPTPEQVDEGHKAMLAGFSKVFETHKVAYGWPDKELRFV